VVGGESVIGGTLSKLLTGERFDTTECCGSSEILTAGVPPRTPAVA